MIPTFIKTCKEQLTYKPELIGDVSLSGVREVLLVGMGGSHLSADIVRMLNPCVHISIHSDYDLPQSAISHKEDILIVVQSHSGNTEEALSAFHMAQKEDMPLAVIAGGGKLLEMAKDKDVPYIQIPQEKIEPRNAIGYGVVALTKLLGEEEIMARLTALADSFDFDEREEEGRALANVFLNRTPIIYSSCSFAPLAYIWKISMNETAKTPAYTNSFPELNHNEIEGLANVKRSKELSGEFVFLFLEDANDDPRIKKRMDVLEKLLIEDGFLVHRAQSLGEGAEERVFSQVALAQWCAYHLADLYHVDPNETKFIESFKAKLQ